MEILNGTPQDTEIRGYEIDFQQKFVLGIKDLTDMSNLPEHDEMMNDAGDCIFKELYDRLLKNRRMKNFVNFFPITNTTIFTQNFKSGKLDSNFLPVIPSLSGATFHNGVIVSITHLPMGLSGHYVVEIYHKIASVPVKKE